MRTSAISRIILEKWFFKKISLIFERWHWQSFLTLSLCPFPTIFCPFFLVQFAALRRWRWFRNFYSISILFSPYSPFFPRLYLSCTIYARKKRFRYPINHVLSGRYFYNSGLGGVKIHWTIDSFCIFPV